MFELNRRRALVALMVVSIAAAGAGAGTMALFSDTETSNNNVVQAGTLDLKVDGGDTNVQLINATNAKPTDSGQGTWNLTNAGSINGSLDIDVTAVNNSENEINDPESDVDSSNSSGELGANLEVYVHTNGGTNITSGWVTADSLSGATYENISVSAGTSKEIVVEWRIPSTVGNVIQTDSVTVDVQFELNQQDGQ